VSATYGRAKRALDVVGASIGLALSSPILAASALAVRLEDGGPVFFRQERVGIAGSTFTVLKLRTMVVGAEGKGAGYAVDRGDSRITRVGRLLRGASIDELPQLWNVLVGDMSLVGPRPERPELLNNLALAIPFFEERMRNVKPGITGLAQINLGYTGSAPDGSPITAFKEQLTNPFKLDGADDAEADDMRLKMLFDLAYSANLEKFASFITTELSVIAKTPLVMLKGLGR
jgi:lipopolysaccharide/colanic/teichoic acid biosynthesis glycosyltransferase